jgi:hypothetical protein
VVRSRSLNDLVDDLAAAERTVKIAKARLGNLAERPVSRAALRPAIDLVSPGGYPNDIHELLAALADNPQIYWERPVSKRTGRPIPNRRLIDVIDWAIHLGERRRKLRESASNHSPAAMRATAEEDQRRVAEARARRASSA